MENNTKKKSVLNLFNILSICVIIAAVVAALYFFVLKGDEKDTVPLLDIEYTVEFGTVRDEFVGNIKVGDVLIDAASQRTIGVVEGVEYNRSSTYSYDKDLGQIVAREYPDHSDFIVTVRAKGTKTAVGYDIEGTLVNVGIPVDARFPNYLNTGYCISVTVITE